MYIVYLFLEYIPYVLMIFVPIRVFAVNLNSFIGHYANIMNLIGILLVILSIPSLMHKLGITFLDPKYHVCGTKGLLNIRSNPNPKSNILDQVKEDTECYIIGVINYYESSKSKTPWVKIKGNGFQSGWVNRNYLCD